MKLIKKYGREVISLRISRNCSKSRFMKKLISLYTSSVSVHTKSIYCTVNTHRPTPEVGKSYVHLHMSTGVLGILSCIHSLLERSRLHPKSNHGKIWQKLIVLVYLLIYDYVLRILNRGWFRESIYIFKCKNSYLNRFNFVCTILFTVNLLPDRDTWFFGDPRNSSI